MAVAAATIERTATRRQILDFGALERAPVTREPFEFLVLPGFIRESALDDVLADYPAVDGPGNFTPDMIDAGPAFESLLDELQSRELASLFGEKFCVDLSSCTPQIGIRGFSEPTDGNIHTDHKSKLVTVLLYFNRTWTHDGGKLRMLRNDHDIEDYAAEVEPLAGTLLAFTRTDDSFHGHKPQVGERKMLQMSYVQETPMLRLEKKVSRLTKPVRRLLNLS